LPNIPLKYVAVSAHINASDSGALNNVKHLIFQLPDQFLGVDVGFDVDDVIDLFDGVLLVCEVGK